MKKIIAPIAAAIVAAALALVAFISEPLTKQNMATPVEARNMQFCAPSFDPELMDKGNAPLFKGLGNLHFAVSTRNKKAQQYFNQGLTLLYAFNHGEAGRSFRAAIKHDSTLAMAWWGMGMVLGPNYNAALNPTSLADINQAMDNAAKYAVNATAKEQALIAALSKRFPKTEVKDMSPYAAAYAESMKQAWLQFPDDPEVIALYGDALMNEHPWNLWLKDGTPQPWTPPIVKVLEEGLKKFPKHPGLNHSYIHTMEASEDAHKALPSSEVLEDLLPAAGHLVHMPAHIYIRTGHYHKGVVIAEKAKDCDSAYVTQCKVQGAYPLVYYPHNIHFLAACAFLEGNSAKAIEAAWAVARNANVSMLNDYVGVQHFSIIPYYVLMHMGKWDDILQLPQPDKNLGYPTAIWHYVRGMALAAQGKSGEAEKELSALMAISKDGSLKKKLIWEVNSAGDLADIAALVLQAELLSRNQQYDAATILFRKAIAIEDALTYQEPPDWFFSVRQTFGHWLVQAGRFAEAEKIYREDLLMYPMNGWSLKGLHNSLQGQGKLKEAAEVDKQFNEAWKWADIKITSSRKY
jgi:tetratricopeptide (TPR) repeat protein